MPSLCLASAWMVDQILFVFSIQEFIQHKLVPGECEHSSSKIRNPKNTKLWFSWEQILWFWLNFSNLWITSHLTKLLRWCPQEINVMLYSCPNMCMRKYVHWLCRSPPMDNSNAVVFTWMSTSVWSLVNSEITLTMVWQKVKAACEDFIHYLSSYM
jgi:hypothetical protein